MEVEKIVLKNKEIVIVGTAHVSKQSVALAEEIIAHEQPDVVGVELDSQRYKSLVHEKQWKETNVSHIIREGKAYLFLTNLLLAGFQKRLGRELGITPGSEMLAAIKIAQQNNASVALLDRDVTITLKRAFALTSVWEKAKICATICGAFEETTISLPFVVKRTIFAASRAKTDAILTA